jgi:hypothetical protein
MRRFTSIAASVLLGGIAYFGLATASARAADHGDAPNVDNDSGADIADVFAFLDPNDNTRVIIIGTVHGFIVPGEAGNFASFDPLVRYRFNIEQTGDAKPDSFITLRFSERTASTAAQTATITLAMKGQKESSYTAPTTPVTFKATPPAQVLTRNRKNKVEFFAGEADDPFFFDIPAFQRFVASVAAGAPDASVFSRGRDSFAGYNVLGIAFSFPVELIRGAADNNVIGVEFTTARRTQTPAIKNGGFTSKGDWRQVDRMGNPAVNVALLPFLKKSAYNASTPPEDAKGKFASDIIGTLKFLGTDDAHISALANVAVLKGDYLRLDLTRPNTGPRGGTNAGAAYPNGRRLADDTIDIILTIIANGAPLGDNCDASDIPPQDEFPFLALPHQPLDSGVDDLTRN